MFRRAKAIYILAVLFLTGCQPMKPPVQLPTYVGLDGPAIANILSDRAAMIHSLTAQCDLTLTRQDEHARPQSVRLDGIMVMQPPDHLRLRISKLNQPVFDLTLLPDGLWVKGSSDSPSQGKQIPPAVGAAQVTRFLAWFQGSFFTEPGLKSKELSVGGWGRLIEYRRDIEGGSYILCDVDMRTATAKDFRLFDPSGNLRFALAMSDYRNENSIIWPGQLRAIAAAASSEGPSEIDIDFTALEFNQDLAPAAFTPPRGAEKQP